MSRPRSNTPSKRVAVRLGPAELDVLAKINPSVSAAIHYLIASAVFRPGYKAPPRQLEPKEQIEQLINELKEGETK